MDASKIIITIGCVLFLALFGVGAWFYLQTPSASPGTTGQPTSLPSNYPNNTTQVGVAPSTSGTQTQTSTEPIIVDPGKEYATLFTNLSAKPIQFTAASSTQGQYGAIYALYASDVANAKKLMPQAGNYSIDVASVDLNGDGVAEIIVYENLPGYCGTGGCPLEIYRKKGSGWENIFSMLAYEPSAVASSQTDGYANLVLSTYGQVGYMTQVSWFTWNGTTYEGQSLIATWNGTSFDLAQ